MYFYVFVDGNFVDEVYQNDMGMSAMFDTLYELREKNWNKKGNIQIVMSTIRYNNPVIKDLQLQEN